MPYAAQAIHILLFLPPGNMLSVSLLCDEKTATVF